MTADNPADLLDLDATPEGPSDADRTWAAALAADPCSYDEHEVTHDHHHHHHH